MSCWIKAVSPLPAPGMATDPVEFQKLLQKANVHSRCSVFASLDFPLSNLNILFLVQDSEVPRDNRHDPADGA